MAVTNPPDDVAAAAALTLARQKITRELDKRIVGQRRVIDQLLISLFANGHGLFVGVPGLAKTLLVSSLAESLNLSFQRIQFTPDLMPSDITGLEVLEQDLTTGRRTMRFVKGPVFANLVLADEINRTPPKTQAALLQSMQEARVTAGGTTHELPAPFLVFATQNPIEQEGTYPLPEAQLDRFMFQIDMDYPTEAEEEAIVRRETSPRVEPIMPVLSPAEILAHQALVRRVPCAEHVIRFAVSLARASRPQTATAPPFVREYVTWGAGPRASQFLILAAKAKAVLEGRFAAAIEDVVAVAGPTLAHRIVLGYSAQAQGIRAHELVERLVPHVTS